MRAYSTDLRQRVLHAVDQGTPRAEVAALFQVSLSTIKRYLKQRRVSGNLARNPVPGRPSTYGAALDAGLPAQLAAHDDATLEQHCQLWEQAHGLRVSTATMSRAIARLGWTRKKNRWVPPSAAKRPAPPGATSLHTFHQNA
jgi:transposase